MVVSYVRTFDKDNNRVEFYLLNFDYYDGNEYLANIFNEEFGFRTCNKYDGIWFKTIHICLGDCTYEMRWHEDVGNAIYCLEQSNSSNELLEVRLKRVIDIVNHQIKK